MTKKTRLDLGRLVSSQELELGQFYALPEKSGHILCMAAEVGGKPAIVILGFHDTQTEPEPPAWVWRDAFAASNYFELADAHVAQAHASGTTVLDQQPDGPPRKGDLLVDDLGRKFIYLPLRLDKLVFSLEEGTAGPMFDAQQIFRRWRLRQRQSNDKGESVPQTLAEYESRTPG